MSKRIINMTIPRDQQLKFQAWIKSQVGENRIKCQSLITETIMRIGRMAIMFAPGDKGFLKNSFYPQFSTDKLSGRIYNTRYYAPYVEFGTGRYAAEFTSKNTDIADYAMTFYVSGKGKTKAQPYLFPAVRIAVREMAWKLHKMGFKEK